MLGAKEYAELFPTSVQYGRLYLLSGKHARGTTFHIFVLPENLHIQSSLWHLKDAVEVYGILGGQPGWTEYYGWLHRGKWEEDFDALVKERRQSIANALAVRQMELTSAEEANISRKTRLLESYK